MNIRIGDTVTLKPVTGRVFKANHLADTYILRAGSGDNSDLHYAFIKADVAAVLSHVQEGDIVDFMGARWIVKTIDDGIAFLKPLSSGRAHCTGRVAELKLVETK